MIKIFEFNKILQKDIKEFILENINNELKFESIENFFEVTKDLENIEENYIDNGGKLLFAYDINCKEIAGTIAVKFENGLAILKRFYVAEKYRKKKIGYLLYRNLEERMKYMQLDKIYLTSGKELVNAHKFYKKNGWSETKSNPGIFIRKGAKLYKKVMKKNEMKEEKDVLEQANMLIEAIPYIKEFVGKIIVIKYDSNAMENNEQKKNVMKQISLLKMLGMKVIFIHDGDHNIEEEFVKLLNLQNCNAIGLSGLDNNFIKCSNANEKLGYVEKIESIDDKLILGLLKDFVLVISPIGCDEDGNAYIIDSDTVSSEIAIALNAKKILFLTNINGILDKRKNVISLLNKENIDDLIIDGTITGEMLPKIKACKRCLDSGVERVHILNGTLKNTIIYELLSDNGIGTMIV